MYSTIPLKRISAIVLALLLAFATVLAIIPPTASAAEDYSTVRVRLSVGSVNTMKMVINGRYFVYENDRMITVPQVVLTASPADGTVVLKDESGNELYRGAKMTIIRLDDQQGQAGLLRLYNASHGWRNYLGHMEVRYSGGFIQIINHISLEKYLYGVVAYEMNNTWPIEALKAQTVAARGYAVKKIRPTATYDLVDTSSDQVYKGFDPAYQNVISAVDGTKYQVLQSGSEIITAYYAASNGGQTDTNKNAWGSAALPYLPIKDDPYDLRNPYSLIQRVSFPKNPLATPLNPRLNDYLKAKAAPLLQQKGYSGFSDQIQIVQIPSVELYAPKFAAPSRNYTRAKVQMVVNALSSVAPTPVPTAGQLPEPVRPVFTPMTDAAGVPVVDASGNPMYMSSTGQMATQEQVNAAMAQYEQLYAAYIAALQQSAQPTVPPTTAGTVSVTVDFPIYDLKDPNLPYQLFTNASLRMFTGESTSNAFNIINVRYGHGVGMSQRGAQQQATEGRSFKQILDFYYTGTRLTTLAITEKVAPTPKPVATVTAVSGAMSTKTNLRAKASTSGKTIVQLASKTPVGILEHSGDWVKVQDNKGNIGYVMLKYVTLKVSTDKPVYATTKAAVSLLSKASSSGKKLLSLAKNSTVSILARSGSYFKVTANGTTGYIADKNLALVLTAMPTTTTPVPTGAPVAGAYTVGSVFALDASKTYGQVVNANVLTIHQSGSLTAAQLGTIPNSYMCEIISKTADDRFYKVVFNGITGYVLLDSINIMPKGATAAVIEVTSNSYKIALPTTSAYILMSMVHGTASTPITSATPVATPTLAPAQSSNAVVIQSVINVYAAASTSSQVLGTLKAGDLVNIVAQSSGWYKISSATNVAYVRSTDVLLTNTSATPTPTPAPNASGAVATGRIAGSNVNFRATASANGTLIGTLAQNTVVYIYSQSGDFYKVSANGTMGYVSKQFVVDQTPIASSNPTTTRKLGSITATSIKLYSKATSASTVIMNLKKYVNVDIISSTSSYYKVKTSDGKVGYALKKYISPLKAPGTATAAVNIRKSAATSASVLKTLVPGDVVEILSTQGEWYKISAAGVTGYVMASYITPLNT